MEIIADEKFNNTRLDFAITNMLPTCSSNNKSSAITRSKVKKMIEEGAITVNSKQIKASYKIKIGDVIKINESMAKNPPIVPENIQLNIIYEDDSLLVLNKQKGILTHPTPNNTSCTLVNALLYYGCNLSDIQGDERRGIVHRLDKNTSGLILVAKTNKAHLNLQKQIQNKTAKRKYLAVVYGCIQEDSGIINKPLVHHMNKTVKMNVSNEGKEAITHYRVIQRLDDTTLLEVELKTGRTHQIRCHMASMNHPVYGDTLYGAKGFKSRMNLKTKEQLLMSYYICFTHPISGRIMEFQLSEEQYDEDFKRFFDIIRR